jgi:hypothetical protein
LIFINLIVFAKIRIMNITIPGLSLTSYEFSDIILFLKEEGFPEVNLLLSCGVGKKNAGPSS